MISYKQWKLLNESLGTYSLGLRSPTNMGLISQYHTSAECDCCGKGLAEMGMAGNMPMDNPGPPLMKKKKHKGKPFPPPSGGDMGDDDMNPDDMGDMDDMGDEDMNPDDMGDEDMGDEDMPRHHHHHIDPDDDMDDDGDMDDMGDEDGDMGDDEMGPDMGDEDGDMGDDVGDMGGPPPHPFAKKKGKHPMMGDPHNTSAFMRRMRAEHCGEDEDDGDELMGKGKKDQGKELAFLQKKTMKKKMSAGNTEAKETRLGKPGFGGGKSAPKGDGGVKHGSPEKQNYSIGKTCASHSAKTGKSDAAFKKGCSVGDDGEVKMCSKCKAKKYKETYNGYQRPRPQDTSDTAFIKSLKAMYGNPHERFSDGLRDVTEDLLLHPDLMPGEAGYPQPLHNYNDPNAVTESLDELKKRIADLEKQLKK